MRQWNWKPLGINPEELLLMTVVLLILGLILFTVFREATRRASVKAPLSTTSCRCK